ncbi:primosomal protein N' [Candidatus Photodesmus blepharus]|uniref:Replication restart protein PriA n=1 Tax=Candidatus Photodesmus blepharonis TaxID=1179155 RepID=A0A084CN63_9GAMM|nr:primosomal protein N' [Candidatus Photodesmus blepharus]KEY91242.1 primosomal protein N' [Candidatus Photodesmus blepharus]
MPASIARIVLPIPLDKQFDYLIPAHLSPILGGRVSVPFGKQVLVGIVVQLLNESTCSRKQLKPISQVLDANSLWPEKLYSLLSWCSEFYHCSLGETLHSALPSMLRKGKPAKFSKFIEWKLTHMGRRQLTKGFGRAVKQAKVMKMLESGTVTHQDFLDEQVNMIVLRTLENKGWIKKSCFSKPTFSSFSNSIETDVDKPSLNQEQKLAIATVNCNSEFGCYLLEGVTGSGKTEVYLNLIKTVLEKGRQALILVPEISLTLQTIYRFKKRFNVHVEVIHSGLTDSERLNAWLSARDNISRIVIGTRSALMTPFLNLGIIIVDEEHDMSYKQKDSLRYHARDVAVMRASKEKIPVILGSATPALETLYNALSGKYHHLTLSQRAGNAVSTKNKIVDVKGLYLKGGLSEPLIIEMRKHLTAKNQVMLFLNRRGFSPVLMCRECGWVAECQRCDAYCTFHQHSNEMRCHHCGSQRSVVHQCEDCGTEGLMRVGVGTERLEEQLAQLFPEYKVIRIDRDSMRRKGSFRHALELIQNGEYKILIGTQMLAKGHHFPNVTLVALLDIDSSLYSSDFRASERLAQLFIQVAGRAGRSSKLGEVILQTHHPEHNLLQVLLNKSYRHFADSALRERKLAMLPPYTFLSLFRAESNSAELVENFMHEVKCILESHLLFDDTSCMILGPNPAPLARRAGKLRWQLLLRTQTRSLMKKILISSRLMISSLPTARKVRWSLDVEPQDLS